MRKYAKLVLIFIVAIQLIGMIIGCTPKAQPKGWVSVEKPPMRVIVFDNEEDIKQETIRMIMKEVGSQKYESYPFNETTQVGVGFDIGVDHHTSSNSQIKIGE